MYKVILAAVDSSARAVGVVKAAIAIADRFEGRVHLLRALSLPPEFPAAARTRPDDLEKVLEEQARTELTTLGQSHPRVAIEPVYIGTREPWRVILDVSRRLGAELIVLGSHGYGGWDRVLGTVAAKVTNHANCHVLVVHEPRKT